MPQRKKKRRPEAGQVLARASGSREQPAFDAPRAAGRRSRATVSEKKMAVRSMMRYPRDTLENENERFAATCMHPRRFHRLRSHDGLPLAAADAIQDAHMGWEYTAPPGPAFAGGGGAPGIWSIGTFGGPLGPRSERAPSLRRDRFDIVSIGRCPSDRVLRAGALRLDRLDRVSAAGGAASVVGSTICVAE